MASIEFKEKHSKRIKHRYLKSDTNDFKGAFKLKDVDVRKEEYKRKRVRVTEIIDEED